MSLPYYLAIRRYLVPLADREAGPQPRRYELQTAADYEAAWHLWRAIRRDAELTDAEREAHFAAMLSCAGIRFECGWCHEQFDPEYVTIPGLTRTGPVHRVGSGPWQQFHGLRPVQVDVIRFGNQVVTTTRDVNTGEWL